jgi:hypothetical protein
MSYWTVPMTQEEYEHKIAGLKIAGSYHPLPFKIGDTVEATRDACFSWNEEVKKGDWFRVSVLSDLYCLHLVPGYYKMRYTREDSVISYT